jgi:hypothetical protein
MNVQLHLVKALLTGKVKRKGMYIRFVSLSFIDLPWFQRFIFIIFIAKGREKLNLINRTSITNQRALIQSFNQETESGFDPNSN